MKKLTINVESNEVNDLESAVKYALEQIQKGYSSGDLENEECEGSFEIIGYE